jgi:hypothetical protein
VGGASFRQFCRLPQGMLDKPKGDFAGRALWGVAISDQTYQLMDLQCVVIGGGTLAPEWLWSFVTRASFQRTQKFGRLCLHQQAWSGCLMTALFARVTAKAYAPVRWWLWRRLYRCLAGPLASRFLPGDVDRLDKYRGSSTGRSQGGASSNRSHKRCTTRGCWSRSIPYYVANLQTQEIRGTTMAMYERVLHVVRRMSEIEIAWERERSGGETDTTMPKKRSVLRESHRTRIRERERDRERERETMRENCGTLEISSFIGVLNHSHRFLNLPG